MFVVRVLSFEERAYSVNSLAVSDTATFFSAASFSVIHTSLLRLSSPVHSIQELHISGRIVNFDGKQISCLNRTPARLMTVITDEHPCDNLSKVSS